MSPQAARTVWGAIAAGMAARSHEGLSSEALEGVHAAGSEARERSLPVRRRTAHPAVPYARQAREACQQRSEVAQR